MDLTHISKLILKLRTNEEVEGFLKDMLTNSELKEISKRLTIAKMLLEKKQYLEIERLTGASSATIAKINDALKYGSGKTKEAIERINH